MYHNKSKSEVNIKPDNIHGQCTCMCSKNCQIAGLEIVCTIIGRVLYLSLIITAVKLKIDSQPLLICDFQSEVYKLWYSVTLGNYSRRSAVDFFIFNYVLDNVFNFI